LGTSTWRTIAVVFAGGSAAGGWTTTGCGAGGVTVITVDPELCAKLDVAVSPTARTTSMSANTRDIIMNPPPVGRCKPFAAGRRDE
jgi:hypothetical protein